MRAPCTGPAADVRARPNSSAGRPFAVTDFGRNRMRLAPLLLALAACTEAASAPECLADAPATTSAAPDISTLEYFRLHNAVTRPASPDWTDAIDSLSITGDAFTLVHLKSIDRAKLSPEQQTQLDGTLAAIAARTPEPTAAALVPELETRLEHAAWADRRCDPLEGTIVPWVGESIAPFAAAPEVRAELERLRDGYESPETDAHMQKLITERVRFYATNLLGPTPGLQAAYR